MSAVEVNECKVWATQAGADWWNDFKSFQSERVQTVKVSLGGDLCQIACDDIEHATWLSKHLAEFGGLPASAVKVIR